MSHLKCVVLYNTHKTQYVMVVIPASEGQTEAGHILTSCSVSPGGLLMSKVDRARPATALGQRNFLLGSWGRMGNGRT